MEKNPLPKELLFSQKGYTIEYDPTADQVTIESTDYHSEKMILTEEIIKKISAKMQASSRQTETVSVHSEKKTEMRNAFAGCKKYVLFAACVLAICLIFKQPAGRKHR